jgi:transcriptional regulator with XRE-family HTH domain
MTGTDLRRILSKNIKLLRGQRSLSQIELAEKADISIPFLSNIERQNKWPQKLSAHTILKKTKSQKTIKAENNACCRIWGFTA